MSRVSRLIYYDTGYILAVNILKPRKLSPNTMVAVMKTVSGSLCSFASTRSISTWMEEISAGGIMALSLRHVQRATVSPATVLLLSSLNGRVTGKSNCQISARHDVTDCVSNSAVDYFISGVLESAGVKDQIKKMNINLGKSCMQLAFVSRYTFELDV
jgi:hypothetical protein